MKKKTFSRILSLMLVAFIGFSSMGMTAYGAEKTDSGVATGQVKETQTFEGNASSAPEGVKLSYQDGPTVDASFVGVDLSETNAVRGTLPASYSSSSYVPAYTSSNYMKFDEQKDIVTPVKDQNPYGTCWSFAAMSVAETSYIMNYGLTSDSVDFNEYQHVWYAYHLAKDELNLFGGDRNVNATGMNDLDGGGNNLISLAMLANWTGASNASEDVFDSSDVLNGNTPADSFAYDDIAHLENGYILTLPNADYYYSSADMKVDMDVVKQAIKDYGSVTMSYYAGLGYPYEADGFQCINIPGYLGSKGTNHAVTIVGWNDNVPASAFPNGADGDGAWLIKNSWGDWYGFDGYFWLSYYDRSIGINAIAFDFASADNYDNNYQYDGGGNYTGYYYDSDYDLTAANAFVADSAETIEAVGVGVLSVNQNYEISIYTDVPAGGAPDTGTLAHTQTGTFTYVGFHTVELTKSVPVDAGERYAVVVTVYNYNEYDDPTIACDFTDTDSWGWVHFYSYAKAGESYVWDSYYGWEDLNAGNTTYADGYNLRIKSYTNEGHSDDPYAYVPYGVAQGADGNWYYFKNGAIQYGYYGLAKNEAGIWYINNGMVDFSVNGLAQCGTDWYYFSGGAVQRVNTVAPLGANWWCVVDGRIDFSYYGLAQNEGGWWYIEAGMVNFGYTGLVQYYGTWYYVENGGLNWNYTGLTNYYGGWYYVEGGVLNWDYTGLVEYYGTWYYVENGMLNWNYTGLAYHYGGWYYVEYGALNWNYTGLVYHNGAWYFVQSGALNWDYTGLVEHNGGWYYVEGGVLNWDYTGLVYHNGAWYYVGNGFLDWTFTGTVYYNGSWWYVENGIMVGPA